MPSLQSLFRCAAFVSICVFAHVVQAASIGQVVSDDTVYMLFSSPNKIERYDLKGNQTLTPIALDREASAFEVKGVMAYIAYEHELIAVNMATGESKSIQRFFDKIDSIQLVGEVIYAFTFSVEKVAAITAFNVSDFSLVDEWNIGFSLSFSGLSHHSVVVGDNDLFFVATHSTSADLYRVTINENGTVEGYRGSPPLSIFSGSSSIWISPNKKNIFDSSGMIYSPENLSYLGSLGGEFNAITFVKNKPVIARSSELFLFSEEMLDAGTLSVNSEPNFLAAYKEAIFAFTINEKDFSLEKLDVSGFKLPEPSTALDGETAHFSPDIVQVDGDDVVYLVDKTLPNIFRWSASQKKYLESWPLLSPPRSITYSDTHDRIYVGYEDGKITYFDSIVDAPTETHFATLRKDILSLIDADEYLFAVDSSGFYTYAKNRVLLNVLNENVLARVDLGKYVWSSETNRIYSARSNWIENLSLDPETGRISVGDILIVVPPSSFFMQIPSFEVLPLIDPSILDAKYINSRKVTLNSDGIVFQVWGADNELFSEGFLPDIAPVGIYELDKKLFVVGYDGNKVNFSHIDLEVDFDNDGFLNASDNCAQQSNPNQDDLDDDGVGDVCDQDMDNDGFDNTVETFSGTDLNDFQSAPQPLTHFVENFSGDWPVGFDNISSPASVLDTSIGSNSRGLYMPSSGVVFSGLFSDGLLSVTFFSAAASLVSVGVLEIIVYVDGQEASRNRVTPELGIIRLPISAGLHTISFAAEGGGPKFARPDQDTPPFGVTLDSIAFSPDLDRNLVPDHVDSCLASASTNEPANDEIEDGSNDCYQDLPNLGPASDLDNDGIINYLDNCPMHANSTQLDMDSDGSGDVCGAQPNDSPSNGDEPNSADECNNSVGSSSESMLSALCESDSEVSVNQNGVGDAELKESTQPDHSGSGGSINNLFILALSLLVVSRLSKVRVSCFTIK